LSRRLVGVDVRLARPRPVGEQRRRGIMLNMTRDGDWQRQLTLALEGIRAPSGTLRPVRR
jgi:hypothetical protein